MATIENTPRLYWTPTIIGTLLWAMATALLLEEAWHAQRFDVATMATPILTAATVAAAVKAHHALFSWRIVSGLAFAALTVLGSLIMASGTLGRLAEAKDTKEATVGAVNRTYGMKTEELKTAREDAKRECKSGVSTKCINANTRVDALTRDLAGIVVRDTDAKATSIARLATLIGCDGRKVKEIVQAFDPVTLPFFLEFGSVLFFAAGFPHRRRKAITVAQPLPESVAETRKAFTRDQALSDFRKLKASGSQQFLAQRWNVSESAVSKWMAGWESERLVSRKRAGKERAVRALPAPANGRGYCGERLPTCQ